MVQVEIAGPQLPQTFDYNPIEIRRRAFTLLDRCVTGPNKIGGFATSDAGDMQNWLTAPGIRLNQPFRTSHVEISPLPILHMKERLRTSYRAVS